jgi:hypothetical protein
MEHSCGDYYRLDFLNLVGYGDYYPKTHLGRFVVVIAVLLGTLMISLTIFALQSASTFSKSESKAYTILRRLCERQKLNDVMIRLIQVNLRIFLMKINKEPWLPPLNHKPQYTLLLRKRNDLSLQKSYLLQKITTEYFTNIEDKFLDLEPRIEEDIKSIKQSLTHLSHFKDSLSTQLKTQKKQIKQLETNIQNASETELQFILLHKKFSIRDTKSQVNISENKSQINPNLSRKLDPNKTSPILTTENFIAQKYQNSISQNMLENALLSSNYNWEDSKAQEILNLKYKNIIDLTDNLQFIKNTHKNISSIKNIDSNQKFYENVDLNADYSTLAESLEKSYKMLTIKHDFLKFSKTKDKKNSKEKPSLISNNCSSKSMIQISPKNQNQRNTDDILEYKTNETNKNDLNRNTKNMKILNKLKNNY